MTKLAALLATSILGLNTYVFYFMGSDEALPPRTSFDEFPMHLDPWHCADREFMTEAIEARLGVTDYWLCNYQGPPDLAPVGVYVGYHERQVRDGAQSFAQSSIHPPKHCLPGAGWNIIDSSVVPVDVPVLEGTEVNRLTIAKGPARQLVYYWYQERGRVIASDYFKIVYLFWDRASRSRSDGALVRFTITIGKDGEEAADAAFRSLAERFLPQLAEYVPE